MEEDKEIVRIYVTPINFGVIAIIDSKTKFYISEDNWNKIASKYNINKYIYGNGEEAVVNSIMDSASEFWLPSAFIYIAELKDFKNIIEALVEVSYKTLDEYKKEIL